MKTRKVLYADEGMVLTNGTTYGKVIFLNEGEEGFFYYEITEEEYDRLVSLREGENPHGI